MIKLERKGVTCNSCGCLVAKGALITIQHQEIKLCDPCINVLQKLIGHCHCVRCDHQWTSVLAEKPLKCPSCFAGHWHKKARKYKKKST